MVPMKRKPASKRALTRRAKLKPKPVKRSKFETSRMLHEFVEAVGDVCTSRPDFAIVSQAVPAFPENMRTVAGLTFCCAAVAINVESGNFDEAIRFMNLIEENVDELNNAVAEIKDYLYESRAQSWFKEAQMQAAKMLRVKGQA